MKTESGSVKGKIAHLHLPRKVYPAGGLLLATAKMRTDFYPLSIFLPLRGGVYHMAFSESSARVMTSALEYIKPIGIQDIDSYKHSHFNPISFNISSFDIPVANISRFQFLRAAKSKSYFGKNMILQHTLFRSDYASKSLHLLWTCIAPVLA